MQGCFDFSLFCQNNVGNITAAQSFLYNLILFLLLSQNKSGIRACAYLSELFAYYEDFYYRIVILENISRSRSIQYFLWNTSFILFFLLDKTQN
jgi:hypothetical protein